MFDGKQITNKLVGSDDERAVSPVIGVILMVAITVILAAVIAAFVMDLGDMSGSANAGIDFDESGDHVTTQVIDEGNTDAIYVEVTEDGGSSEYVTDEAEGSADPDSTWSVGTSVELNSDDLGTDDDIDDIDNDFDTLSGGDEINEITVYGEIDGDLQVVASWDN
ncbi:type IV pilin [Salinadaptatus halalkaliphilus]|uniref:Type IV pilin n=2 Tax=Salinadaptatus halalkaliphilus TaxID=2419781 RepID=A0A4S3TLN9_9EURY|nr:type IV pilin N-terminal domain-containing protein [Salinadaptatus halalkaliphilus]THE64520.1 type IV pilin [Salinadaptatus halalkaliphilus]